MVFKMVRMPQSNEKWGEGDRKLFLRRSEATGICNLHFSTAVTSSSSQTNKNRICQHFSKGTGNKLFQRRLNNDSNVLKISERRVICRGIKNCVQLELK